MIQIVLVVEFRRLANGNSAGGLATVVVGRLGGVNSRSSGIDGVGGIWVGVPRWNCRATKLLERQSHRARKRFLVGYLAAILLDLLVVL